ncbi:hypothetical protein MICPUN_62154 [Micromonas commoda]|uniref:Uncharacterized protein n=1 Tax=Micromonas commoda (strain RCC299 / NOUM17 / CCMP2709) TaxID=296587 RepID=C1FHP6_MICCC|nr:hypothetical protein MICPUN_62154 [Micromonas commoda]ACO69856.1 hypothetical protein MICPUN_62154 [Micromonas commoda]|eukprot:XP_002508598.1 hypothetical protein MICPUN_62154 [Micromonas commoda]
MAGEKPGFEWNVPEDRDADAAARAARMDPPAPRPPETVIHEGEDAARVIYGEVCAICRDDVTRRGRIDACDHLFCLPCIKRWAKIETKCPLCKARFSFIQPEDLVPPDPESRPSTRGARAGGPQKELKRIYLPHRDQIYEGDGELPDGMDIEEVLCGRCGDGGDEDKLMLCDGCDQGYHCYCVGLDSVPMDEWRCAICAVEDEDDDDGNVTTDHLHETAEDESTRRDEAMARSLQRAEDAAAARAERDELVAAARERAAMLRNARRNARRGGRDGETVVRVRTVGAHRRARERREEDEEDEEDEEGSPAWASAIRPARGSNPRPRRPPPAVPYRPPGEDARRRTQIARVAELRRLWERYRTGAIAFDGGDGTEAPNASNDVTHGVTHDVYPPDDARRPFETGVDDWELARAATGLRDGADTVQTFEPASTLTATIGAGEPRRELKRPASRRERGAPVPAVGAGVAGVAGARPSPPPPPTRPSIPSSEWVNPPPPPDSVTHRPVTHRPVRRRVTDVKVTAASGGRLPPGISFSPPRPPASTRTKRGGWSDDSDDEEPSVRKRLEGSIPAGVEFHKKSLPPRLPRHEVPATSFVPPGVVKHTELLSGSDPADAKRRERETESAAMNFGAMDKKRVAARARHFLRPAWTSGKVRGKDTFKEYAKRATQAGFAAACALAIKTRSRLAGASEDEVLAGAEARAREMSAAVDRAVRAALRKLGVETTEDDG